jgi:GNAT superfamily N-acetyltransferase
MPAVRRAMPADAAEVTRLRGYMLEAMGVDVDSDPGWRGRCEQVFCELLDSPRFVAFVIDGDEGLAATGTGWVDKRLPGPGSDGLVGYVANMSTDPAHRRQGHARRILEALLAWFEAQGVHRVDLHATDEGRPLYEGYGFDLPDNVSLARPFR